MSQLNDQPIGVFDSGIGGLTVAQALHKRLPGEDILYLGDTARVPYGVKSRLTVKRYALECALFLLNRGVKLIVAACNTVSAVALQDLSDLLRAPMIGVLEPGVNAALANTRDNRIGIIGTPATIQSKAYQKRLIALSPGVQVWSRACPLLAPMAEEGRLHGPVVEMILSDYLKPLMRHKIDTLVLGCTHYPLFKPALRQMLRDKVKLIDSAESTAEEVEKKLLIEGLIKTHGKGSVRCYVTDMPRKIKKMAKLFFGAGLINVRREKIDNIVN